MWMAGEETAPTTSDDSSARVKVNASGAHAYVHLHGPRASSEPRPFEDLFDVLAAARAQNAPV